MESFVLGKISTFVKCIKGACFSPFVGQQKLYLEYLVEMNVLATQLLYGTVGRPERNYVLCETYEQN